MKYHRCYDGDTCTFSLPGVHPLFGKEIPVRLAGIDTPEIKAACLQEKVLALQAREYVRTTLSKAQRIDLIDASRGKYFRVVARIVADGQDLTALLLNQNLGVPYASDRKSRPWCRS